MLIFNTLKKSKRFPVAFLFPVS